MSSNKKALRQKKYLRRLNEIKKATARVDTRTASSKFDEKIQQKSTELKNTTNSAMGGEKYQLPIKEIKKDLKENLIFAFFSVALVIGLKITGFGFDQIKHLLNL